MTLKKGVIEMLEHADEEPRTFSDFVGLKIGDTGLSSSTVTERLKEMVAVDLLEESTGRSKSGRRTVVYETTQRGKKVLELADEYRKIMNEGL